ncbi:hypothetical protein CYMTET_21131 [Cymbomonas tetramitiformis]|uniref:Uncharacterized protein n=1 Tax=Cymbomonas tetramitiformis TaxID=36881 RepID=A0AAE0G2S3_9CHLO|nr:hypothetical protein CYMTET_21131 [Cymbomonas tetramitiformis]
MRGQQVIATDFNEKVLEMAKGTLANVAKQHGQAHLRDIALETLPWGDMHRAEEMCRTLQACESQCAKPESCTRAQAGGTNHTSGGVAAAKFDVIVASDVVYDPTVHRHLADTISAMTHADSVVLIAFRDRRSASGEDHTHGERFLSTMADARFTSRDAPLEASEMPGGEEQESTGSWIRVLELHRTLPGSAAPV